MRRLRALILLALTFPMGAAAQSVLRGTVVDSVSQRPVPGVVVTILNAKGESIGRVLTDGAGKYTTVIPAGAARVRVLRIGWRPRERALPDPVDGVAVSNFAMTQIPTFLEPARVDAKQCAKYSDSQQALGLWEQVRTGLLATLVSREQNPGTMVRLDFEQTHEDVAGPIQRLSLKRDSSARVVNSYGAVRSGSDFTQFGFASEATDATREFYAPDAEVMIDGGFAAGYCFRIQRGDRNRPNQVGLGFAAADRRPGRIDIEGALWVDTIARSIKSIEFRYIGINPSVDELNPGGTISFREFGNGITLIDRWQLRLIGNHPDTVITSSVARQRIFNRFYTTATGGEVAHARWPDGTKYDATLARAQFTLTTRNGAPAIGRIVGLAETPYVKQLDATGVFSVPDLIPGPYALIVGEPRLRPLMMDSMPTRIRIEAARGTTRLVSAVVPTLEDWTMERCAAQARLAATDTTLILGRVLDLSGAPIARASVKIEAARRDGRVETAPYIWETIMDGALTDGDGLLQHCTSKVFPSAPRVRISGRLPDGELFQIEQDIANERLTVIPISVDRVIKR